MRKLLLIILFFVSWAAAKAQDKIITVRHDTIECRIISINAERISYEQKTPDNQFVGKSIPMSKVMEYIRTGNAKKWGGLVAVKPMRTSKTGESLPAENVKKRGGLFAGKPGRIAPEYRWMFALQGGMAHSLMDFSSIKSYILLAGNPESDADAYIRKLQNGYHISSSLHYLLTASVGLGIDYNVFYSASKADFLMQGLGASNIPFYIKWDQDDRIYTHFAGPSALFLQYPDKKKKFSISETISPGMVLFRNESRNYQTRDYQGDNGNYNGQSSTYYEKDNTLTTSTSFGAKAGFSLNYAITPRLSAGLAGNFMWAKLHKISTRTATVESKGQTPSNPVKVSHIDYGFIVRYSFNHRQPAK